MVQKPIPETRRCAVAVAQQQCLFLDKRRQDRQPEQASGSLGYAGRCCQLVQGLGSGTNQNACLAGLGVVALELISAWHDVGRALFAMLQKADESGLNI